MKKPVGDQELVVLRWVAEHGPVTVGEVAEKFGEPQGLARSTILTVMERLRGKGHLLARTVFFFHPLVRRACREYALAREEACDAAALQATGAAPHEYGRLLLLFGVARAPAAAAAPGASSHLAALKPGPAQPQAQPPGDGGRRGGDPGQQAPAGAT